MKPIFLLVLTVQIIASHYNVFSQTRTIGATNIGSTSANLNIIRNEVNVFSMATFVPVTNSFEQLNGNYNYNYSSLGSALSEPPYCSDSRIVSIKDELICIRDATKGNLIKTINNTFAIESYAIGRNGELLLCSDKSGNVSLWNLFNNLLLMRFPGKTGPIGISSDGNKLFMCSGGRAVGQPMSIQVYNVLTKTYIFHKQYPDDSIVRGNFSVNGSNLLIKFHNSRAEYWNYETDSMILDWQFDKPGKNWSTENFNVSLWSDDKKIIVSGYKKNKPITEIWDILSKKLLKTAPLAMTRWNPALNGTDLLLMNDTTLLRVNVNDKQNSLKKFQLPRAEEFKYEKIVGSVISSDYRRINIITSRGRLFELRFFDLSVISEAEISIASYSDIERARVSPDNKKLLFYNFNYFDGSHWGILDLETQNIEVIQDTVIINRAKLFKSSTSSSLLFVQSYYSSDLWNTMTGKKTNSFQGIPQQSGISPDMKIIVDGKGNCFDVQREKTIAQINYPSEVNSIAFFPNSQFLAAKFADDKFAICNIYNGNILYQAKLPAKVYSKQTRKRGIQDLDQRFAHVGDLDPNAYRIENFDNSIAVAPNGEFIAIANYHDIHLFTKDGQFLRTLVADDSDAVATVVSLTFSPGSDKIIAGYQYGNIFQWDLSGKELMRYSLLPIGYGKDIYTTNDEIKKIRFFNNQGDFYALSANGLLKIISPYNRTLEKIIPVHTKERILIFDPNSSTSGEIVHINDCAVSDDGKWFSTSGNDHTVEVWNCLTGEKQLYEAEANVKHLAFIGNNQQLLLSLENGASAVLDLVQKKQVCQFLSFSNGNWYTISADFLFDTNTPESMDEIAWNFPSEPMSILGAEVFMRDYYTPGLLGKLISQRSLNLNPSFSNLESLNRATPAISKIQVIPKNNGVVDVDVTVVSQGINCSILPHDKQKRSGAYNIKLFRNGQLIGDFPEQVASFNDNRDTTKNIYKNKSLTEWRQSASVLSNNDTAVIKFKNISLPESVNHLPISFSAYAFNEDRVKGSTTTQTFRSTDSGKHKKRAFVVSIGISQTQNGWNLATPMLDATSFAKDIPLKLSGRFDEIVAFSLTSSADPSFAPQIHATKANIRFLLKYLATGEKHGYQTFSAEQLKRLYNINSVGPDDIIIISFSGHGFATEKSLFYLVPYDTGPTIGLRAEDIQDYLNNNSSEGTEDAVSFIRKCISSAELLSWMQKIDAKNIFLIIDACYAGAVVGSEQSFRPGPMGDAGFGQFAYDKGMSVLTASQAKEISIANLGTTHGLLTSALLSSENISYLKVGDVYGWLHAGVVAVPEIFKRHYPFANQKDCQTPILFDFRK